MNFTFLASCFLALAGGINIDACDDDLSIEDGDVPQLLQKDVQIQKVVNSALVGAEPSIVKGRSNTRCNGTSQLAWATQAHTRQLINANFLAIALFIATSVLIGLAVEVCFPAAAPAEGHPPAWVAAFIIASYLLLVPGICFTLFSFKIVVELPFGEEVGITHKDGKASAYDESMLTFLAEMWQSGGYIGSLLVAIYALVIPIMKGLLLIAAELWRHSDVDDSRKSARFCIKLVQKISKWACPDMFAYMLLLYLLRNLDGDGGRVVGIAHLDVGFTFFGVFCVCSAVSSLFISFPLASKDLGLPKPYILLYGSEEILFKLVCVLFLIFSYVMYVGIFSPCISLSILPDPLLEPKGNVPRMMEPMLGAVASGGKDVSLWQSCAGLWNFVIDYREVNCLFAWVMIAFFVIAFTVMDMFAIVVAAYQLSHGFFEDDRGPASLSSIARTIPACILEEEDAASGDDSPPTRPLFMNTSSFKGKPLQKKTQSNIMLAALYKPSNAMAVSRVLRHISMLDVLVMGVIVTCCAARSYEEQGLLIQTLPGLWLLLCAELIHYAAYYLVWMAIDFTMANANRSLQSFG